ncbi:uncharacterized protein LOC132753993 [Ruditapes philippinarum]|uniref:uncharacterized protein LOC132753993 n=1 Tax=Ruditapes philippinarum TaxID=129788 RepID=UPI00295A6E86|nr:uncharacterized protein LOC132753993 [Ruditapes philippinarum]
MPRRRKTASEKKRTAQARQQRFWSKQISLDEQIDRWKEMKTIIGVPTDDELAKHLIDCYLEKRAGPTLAGVGILPSQQPTPTRSMSTPKGSSLHVAIAMESELSSVTEGSESGGELMSKKLGLNLRSSGQGKRAQPGSSVPKGKQGIKVADSKGAEGGVPTPKHRKIRIECSLSESELESLMDPDFDPDDPTYEPEKWNISIIESDSESDVKMDDLEEEGVEDNVFDIQTEIDEDEPTVFDVKTEVEEISATPTSTYMATKMKHVTKDHVLEEKYITTQPMIEKLLDMVPVLPCSSCQNPVKKIVKTIGCTIECKWLCSNSHVQRTWSSSALLQTGMYSTNFQAMSTIILSGNSYQKIALWAKFLGLKFPGRTSFYTIQTKCVVPEVESFWICMRDSYLEELRGTKIVLAGDARMDSPGFCANSCTYTQINQADKTILTLETVDKRETMLKSTLMEAKGFQKAMGTLIASGIVIEEVVTDAHPQIGKIMKNQYPHIRHSLDMWLGGKSLGKRVAKVASIKGNEALIPWAKDIVNHFYHSAENSRCNVTDMKTKWVSILQHTVNNYSWRLGECDHGPIEDRENKPWLISGSKIHTELRKLVFDKRFLRKFDKFVTCQTTSELESFNNHILMYAPKRNAFSYLVYRCRCQLAAIDYNKHLHRQQKTDKEGKPRWKRVYSKASKNWSVQPIKESKDYLYISELQVAIMERYLRREYPLSSKVRLSVDHPKRISIHSAPVEPLPTAELAERQIKRIKTK